MRKLKFLKENIEPLRHEEREDGDVVKKGFNRY